MSYYSVTDVIADEIDEYVNELIRQKIDKDTVYREHVTDLQYEIKQLKERCSAQQDDIRELRNEVEALRNSSVEYQTYATEEEKQQTRVMFLNHVIKNEVKK